MLRTIRRAVPGATLLLLAACDGGPAVPGVSAGSLTFADAAGDTLLAPGGNVYRAIDLLGIEVARDAETIELTLRFAAPVVPWSQGAPNSLDGFVDFDTDREPRTGIPSAAEEYGGGAALGAEYYLSLRDSWPGQVGLKLTANGTWFRVPVVFDGARVTMRIGRNRMLDPDGRFDMAAVVGHPRNPATDFGGPWRVD